MGATEGNGARYQVRRTGALSMRGTGGTVLAIGGTEVLRRVSGTTVSRVPTKGILPYVNPRTPATPGQKTAEGIGLGKRDRTGQISQKGPAALRLCNLVAQG